MSAAKVVSCPEDEPVTVTPALATVLPDISARAIADCTPSDQPLICASAAADAADATTTSCVATPALSVTLVSEVTVAAGNSLLVLGVKLIWYSPTRPISASSLKMARPRSFVVAVSFTTCGTELSEFF